MSSLKELHNRIAAVRATQKITRAMQMVAAARARQTREMAEQARPYHAYLSRLLAYLARQGETQHGLSPLLAGRGEIDSYLLLVMTADRGLCGSFNNAIARQAQAKAKTLLSEGKQVKILCVGRKGADMLRRELADYMLETISFRDKKSITFADARHIANKILALFASEDFDSCILFYSQFINVITQKPQAVKLIPFLHEGDSYQDESHKDKSHAGSERVGRADEISDGDTSGKIADAPEQADAFVDLGGAVYDYEPTSMAILNTLLPHYITIQIFHGLRENTAGEQGARMTAMDNATRNAGEMIDKLSIAYNRTRQAQITRELVEIISGAEAL